MDEVRLIDANALKEAIRKRLGISSLKYLTEQEKVIVEEIENAPTVEAHDTVNMYCDKDTQIIIEQIRPQGIECDDGEWIPVSERLPEQANKSYLVTLEYKEHGKGVTTLWYHGEGIGWDLRVADVVTAWQPLPEPYKKGGVV